MTRQVFFVSGAYGVGKTTLCNKLALKVKIPAYSASDLISPKVEEYYGAQKSVKNKDKNQQALLRAIEELPEHKYKIILAGHFCIFNRNREVEILPDFVFTSLGIEKIILLLTDSSVIKERLYSRDNINYPFESITNLIYQEQLCAERISTLLNCPLYIHTMHFDEHDVDALASFLMK